jgi:hypothetical protein
MQAAYNIGGHTINVEMIQGSILGCRLPRPGQVNPIPEIHIKYQKIKGPFVLLFTLNEPVYVVDISCWPQHASINL